MTSAKRIGCTLCRDISGHLCRASQDISGSDSPTNSVTFHAAIISVFRAPACAQMLWEWERVLERVLGQGSPMLWCCVALVESIRPAGSWTTGAGSDWVVRPPVVCRLSALLKVFPQLLLLFPGVDPAFLMPPPLGPGDGMGPMRFLSSYILHSSVHSPWAWYIF